MKRIVQALGAYFGQHGASLSTASALEMFGRDGSWATIHLAHAVKSICVWEINEDYLEALRSNMPYSAQTYHGDSIAHVQELVRTPGHLTYDVISVDNPHGLYGEDNCEHFNFLADAAKALGQRPSAIVFLACLNPYDPREGYPDGMIPQDSYGMTASRIDNWFDRRDAFYGRNARHLTADFVVDFYLSFLKAACGCDFKFLELSMETTRSGRICFGKA